MARKMKDVEQTDQSVSGIVGKTFMTLRVVSRELQVIVDLDLDLPTSRNDLDLNLDLQKLRSGKLVLKFF